MTNILAYQFENLDTQRATYSNYYGTWYFEGEGVGVQLCGWIVIADLWVGAVSDTDYNKKAGYLKEQQKLQENDLVFDNRDALDRLVVFLILYNREHRAKMVAYLEGKQEVMQLPASKSSKRFRDRIMVYAATVEHD